MLSWSATSRCTRSTFRSDFHVISFDQLNAYDVLVSDDIVFTKAAFDAFVAARLDKDASTESAANQEVSA